MKRLGKKSGVTNFMQKKKQFVFARKQYELELVRTNIRRDRSLLLSSRTDDARLIGSHTTENHLNCIWLRVSFSGILQASSEKLHLKYTIIKIDATQRDSMACD